MRILVTGGCGFIGSHLVDELVRQGHQIRVYDILEPQVHQGKKPGYLNKEAEYIYADLRNKDKLKKALKGIEVVFHEAAQVGVGQSMYELERYVSHNSTGTAILLELLVNTKNKVQKLMVASSMSIYGEGIYRCPKHGKIYPSLRPEKQLKKKDWAMRCPKCNAPAKAMPTDETKPLMPNSVYATTKRSQEELCLEIGIAYKLPTVALRYFNAYGPRQSLSNPYTGVAAIFLSRVKNNNPPLLFEDGLQSRDFINVADVVQANILAMKKKQADYNFFNVGSGKGYSIQEIGQTICSLYGNKIKPKVLNKFRAGDIRHCYADTKKISTMLGFKPKVSFKKGMLELIAWSENQKARDLSQKAHQELSKRGLA